MPLNMCFCLTHEQIVLVFLEIQVCWNCPNKHCIQLLIKRMLPRLDVPTLCGGNTHAFLFSSLTIHKVGHAED